MSLPSCPSVRLLAHACVCLTALVVAGCGNAPAGAARAPAAARPTLDIPKATRTPLVDASADDPAWLGAPQVDALTLATGSPAAAPYPTTVALQWDAEFLYLRFTCRSDLIDAPYDERDANHHEGDVVEVFLDPKGDSRQWIEIQVTPRNRILDNLLLLTADPVSRPDGRLAESVFPRDWWADRAWNLDGLRTAARVVVVGGTITGWVADLAIPADPTLKRLARTTFAPMTMRMNLLRYEWRPPAQVGGKKLLVAMDWATVVDGCPHFSPQAMGVVRLVE